MDQAQVYQPNLRGIIHYVGQMLLPIFNKMALVVLVDVPQLVPSLTISGKFHIWI